jgi:hypothetical protein
MNVASRENYECEPASVHELETSPCLERNFRKLFWADYTWFSYLKRDVTMITSLDKCYPNKFFKSELEIDLSKVEYWTILDSPICAKIQFKDSIIPGMLMTITCDGNKAPLVFFPMALCCSWSKDPSSPFYDENYIDSHHLFGHIFKWNERPFSQIFSLFRKGKRIAFSCVSNRVSEYEPPYIANYIHIW